MSACRKDCSYRGPRGARRRPKPSGQSRLLPGKALMPGCRCRKGGGGHSCALIEVNGRAVKGRFACISAVLSTVPDDVVDQSISVRVMKGRLTVSNAVATPSPATAQALATMSGAGLTDDVCARRMGISEGRKMPRITSRFWQFQRPWHVQCLGYGVVMHA